ncbi:MAG: hypothetical protein ACRCWM_09320 [Sarcina sp.]
MGKKNELQELITEYIYKNPSISIDELLKCLKEGMQEPPSKSTLQRTLTALGIFKYKGIFESELFLFAKDLELQLNFIKLAELTTCEITILKTVVQDFKLYKSNLDSKFSSVSIRFKNNYSIAPFVEMFFLLDDIFNLNIFSNSIGYKCITFNFVSLAKARKVVKLLWKLQSDFIRKKTIFEIMDICKIKRR